MKERASNVIAAIANEDSENPNAGSTEFPSDAQFKEALIRGFVDDPRVWRNAFLIPGQWESPSLEECADFLVRLVRQEQAEQRISLVSLFRPLALRRYRLRFGPLVLWHVAFNAKFDLGSYDVLEILDPAWQWRALPSDSAGSYESRLGIRAEQKRRRRIVPVEDVFPFTPVYGGESKQHGTDLSPRFIASCLWGPDETLTADGALDLAIFSLGLSRRRDTRVRVLFPNDLRTVGACGADDSLLGARGADPEVELSGGCWSVSVSVLVAEDLFHLTVKIEAGTLRIDAVRREGRVAASAVSEWRVGPVRVSGLTPAVRKKKKGIAGADPAFADEEDY